MRFPHLFTHRNCLAAISGILTAVSFYNEKLSFAVFFSLIPLFKVLTEKIKLKYIFIYSVFYYSFSLVWLSNAVSKLTQNILPKIILSLFLIVLVSFILSLILTFPFLVYRYAFSSHRVRLALFPFIYILGEWFQGNLIPVAFPWIRLGNIASDFTVFIQSASIFGTLFISALIIYINLLLTLILKSIKNRKCLAYSAILLVIVFSDLTFGLYNLKSDEKIFSEKKSVIIVQGNYPKDTKFRTSPDVMLKKYLTLLCSSQSGQTDLIIFPETAIHSKIIKKDSYIRLMAEICRKYDALMIFGSQYNNENKSYNACMTIDKNKILNTAYLKRVLVPIGEYNPMNIITGKYGSGDFSVGTECLLINSDDITIGTSICFESAFPDIVSESVRKGAEAIAVLTNDSWLGRTIPLYQHHSHSVMRAVENSRYVLTSTNTGISSVIDNHGKIMKKSISNTEAVISEHFYANNNITTYTRIGDIIILPACFYILYVTIKHVSGKIYKKIRKNT